jgi:hypothetical protein
MNVRIVAVAALVGACTPVALGQFVITPGGASAGNGVFRNGAIGTSITGTGVAGADFRATTATSTDNMFQSWWWFRPEGANREYAFNNGSADGFTVAGTLVGDLTGAQDMGGYDFTVSNAAGPLFRSEQRWRIITAPAGPVVLMSNSLTNLTSSPLLLHMYAYNDFDPNGNFGHPYSYSGGTFYMSSGPIDIEWTGIGHSAYQATAYSTLRGLLANTVADNLNNTVTGAPGDFTGAFQWSLPLDPSGTVAVGSTFAIVPAPGAAGLLLLGGIAAARRRRR